MQNTCHTSSVFSTYLRILLSLSCTAISVNVPGICHTALINNGFVIRVHKIALWAGLAVWALYWKGQNRKFHLGILYKILFVWKQLFKKGLRHEYLRLHASNSMHTWLVLRISQYSLGRHASLKLQEILTSRHGVTSHQFSSEVSFNIYSCKLLL
jgi:hypothetical protein